MDWFDFSGDGVGDFGVADYDSDGLIDHVSMDNDYNGTVDGYGYDLDENGMLEVVERDTDGDGVMDAVGRDVTGDGVLDTGSGPATGGASVALPQPVDPNVAIVGGTPAGGNGLLTGPHTMTDPLTALTARDINQNIVNSGAIWTLPDRW